ncbi:MAG: hypothetical protein AAF078_11630 [Planctomycetota bacterium]
MHIRPHSIQEITAKLGDGESAKSSSVSAMYYTRETNEHAHYR